MIDERLNEILAALHWNDRTLALVLNEHWTLIRRWHTDPSLIPLNVERWLERIAKEILVHPQPRGWPDPRTEKGPAP